MTSNPDDFPWLAAAERVYGPLADAFGLHPARGTFVGGKAQAVLAPGIADWLEARNLPEKKSQR